MLVAAPRREWKESSLSDAHRRADWCGDARLTHPSLATDSGYCSAVPPLAGTWPRVLRYWRGVTPAISLKARLKRLSESKPESWAMFTTRSVVVMQLPLGMGDAMPRDQRR